MIVRSLFFIAILFLMQTNLSAQWTQLGLDIDGEATGDWSGRSVGQSSDGLTVAIGARFNSGIAAEAGHVRVYKYISGTWTQLGLDIDGEAEGDFSGWSVDLSSDGLTVAIGAIHNDGGGINAGHVRVYKFISGVWVQQGLDIDGEAPSDNSGRSLSLSSDGLTLAIGANGNEDAGTNAGHVRVYKFISGAWEQQGLDIDGEAAGDNSGYSVSLSSDGLIVAIGAISNDGTATNAGHTRVYKFISGVWVQQGLDIDGEAAGDYAGHSVSLSSDGLILAIGAINNDGVATIAGHTRVYKFISGVWVQQGLDIDGEAFGDNSGWSVDLSSDGLTLAIGATGIDAGQVRVYKFISGAWVQEGLDIEGETADDASGFSVRLSSGGLKVAIAAPFNDGTGLDAGHVRVYSVGCFDPSIPDLSATPALLLCPGEEAELGIIGDLNDATAWQVYTDSCGGTFMDSTAGSSIIVTPMVTTTYFIRGEGDCITSGPCTSITVTVEPDVTPPTIFCPMDLTVSADSALCEATGVEIGIAEASDDCSDIILSNDAPATFPVGTTIITWTATDSSDNTATCEQVVTVTDDEFPSIIGCPSDISVDADAPGCTANPTWAAPSYTDNCAGGSMIESHTSGSSFSEGVTTVDYTATDESGNMTTCAFTVTVIKSVDVTTTLTDFDITANAVGAGITYEWMDCLTNSIIIGETDQTYSVITNGEYAVIVNDNGCIDTSECIVISELNLHELITSSAVNIYPNPTEGEFTIQLENIELVKIEIQNLQGKLIYTKQLNETTMSIDLSEFERGIYIVNIHTNKGVVNKQIVLE